MPDSIPIRVQGGEVEVRCPCWSLARHLDREGHSACAMCDGTGWRPLSDGPEDQPVREALDRHVVFKGGVKSWATPDGEYRVVPQHYEGVDGKGACSIGWPGDGCTCPDGYPRWKIEPEENE